MLRHSLIPLAAASLLLIPEAPQQGGAGTDIFGRPMPEDAARSERMEPFLGCWKLVQIDDPILPQIGRTEDGYLLFTPGYMALEWHVKWDSAGDIGSEDDFASGIHTWSIDPLGNLTSNILIGAFLDQQMQLGYEQAGAPWKYQASIAGGMLTLRRPDGSRMMFMRNGVGATGPDIYGRTTESHDLFGRRIKSAEEDEDEEGRGGDGR
jgi:hypothetical protein